MSMNCQVKLLERSVLRREKERRLVVRSNGCPAPKSAPKPVLPPAPPQVSWKLAVVSTGVFRVSLCVVADTKIDVFSPMSPPEVVSERVRNPPIDPTEGTVFVDEALFVDIDCEVVKLSIRFVTVAAKDCDDIKVATRRVRAGRFIEVEILKV